MPLKSVRNGSLRVFAVTGISVALAAAAGRAQSVAADRLNARASVAPAAALAPDYVIGPDDVLSVVFWKEPEISAQVRVRPDGKISLPLLRDVRASGLTPEQLRQQLEADAKPFFAETNATVTVNEVNSRKVFVTGEVGRPGAFPLTGPMTILQALALAGGFSDFADQEHIEVFRSDEAAPARFRFNYKDVLNGKRPDVALKSGDTIVVR
jgi:polysaccharide export outer membrane protein